MPAVELIAGLVIALAALYGLARGLARVLPLAGFVVGAVLGTRLPLLFGDLDSDFSLVAAIPGALIAGALVAALVEQYGAGTARRIARRPALNAFGGALTVGATGVVMVWMLAPAVAEIRSVHDPIARSDLLAGLNSVLTPAGPEVAVEPPPIDRLPTFAGPGPNVAPGDASVLLDPDVKTAERSVLRIEVRGCRGHGSGSGWVAARGIVATNAHVVSGGETISVQPRGRGPHRPAVPIWFDGEHDIALLRVAGLGPLRILPMVDEPRAGTPGATLGFPLGRRAIRRARVGPTTDRVTGNLGGPRLPGVSDRITGRLVTTVRGRSQPGNSGGPIVDARGRVLTTVFAGGLGVGTLGVPNRFVRAGLRQAGPRVGTGNCEE